MDDIPIYRTLYPGSQTVDVRKELEEGRIDCVVLTSASTADGLARMAGQENLKGAKPPVSGQRPPGGPGSTAWTAGSQKKQL